MSMIIAAVIAAVALLALVIVTGLYLKRTTTYKAIISGDRKSSKTAFTNRAFKVNQLKSSFTPNKLIGHFFSAMPIYFILSFSNL